MVIIGRYQHTQETKKDGKNLNERAMALSHIEQITQQDNLLQGRCFHEKDLYLFDMGYPALYFIAYLIGQGKDFVFRCSKSFLREVQEVIAQGTKDQVIEIPLKTSRRNFPEQLKTLQTPFTEESVIPLRVLLVPLESGETEVLLTSLTDKKRYHYNDFKEVYHLRWGSETYYSFLKESLQLENRH